MEKKVNKSSMEAIRELKEELSELRDQVSRKCSDVLIDLIHILLGSALLSINNGNAHHSDEYRSRWYQRGFACIRFTHR